jgi:hypothetical protein
MHRVRLGRRGGRRVAIFVCAALLGLAALPLRVCADERTVKPFLLIDRARVRWDARPRPKQLSFVVDFTGRNKDRFFRRLFRVDASIADHSAHVTMLDSEGSAPPFVQPEKSRLLPTETFGFVSSEGAPSAPTPGPLETNLPVIAAVHATVRYAYDVRFIGEENVDDRSAYHLQLDPRQTPDAYPLRDIWIDESTYDVLQVVAQQFEHLGPITIPYRLSARYAQEGPYWLITHAQAGATIHAGVFSYRSSGDAAFEDFQYAP